MVSREEWGKEEVVEEEGGGVAMRAEEKGEGGGEGFATTVAVVVIPPTDDVMKPADRDTQMSKFLYTPEIGDNLGPAICLL